MKILFSPSCNVQSPQVPSTLFDEPLLEKCMSFTYAFAQRVPVAPRSCVLFADGNKLPAKVEIPVTRSPSLAVITPVSYTHLRAHET